MAKDCKKGRGRMWDQGGGGTTQLKMGLGKRVGFAKGLFLLFW